MKSNPVPIGEIEELFGVSKREIRLYEKKGIIKPTEADNKRGQRCYSAEQVQRLSLLLEFKAMGFSVDKIKEVMDSEMPKEQMIAALRKEQKEEREACYVERRSRL